MFPDKNSKRAKLLYRNAKLAERAGNIAECRTLNAQALILDNTASQADWILLQENPRHFRERRALYRILSVKLDDLTKKVQRQLKQKDSVESPKVFVYWGQGFDAAPSIVQAARKRTELLSHAEDVVFLTDSNIGDYVSLPQSVLKFQDSRRAAFSDVLRFSLLAEHGGIWMDATCFPSARLLDHFPTLVKGSDFFAFDKGKSRDGNISSWFLAATAQSYIAHMMKEALWLYCDLYDTIITYFFCHHIFRHLYRLDPIFYDAWNSGTISPLNPRVLHRKLFDPVDLARLSEDFDTSIVQKLTYKGGQDADANSLLKFLEKNPYYGLRRVTAEGK